MASPFVRIDADGRIHASSDKQAADLSAYFDVLTSETISAAAEIDTHPNATLTGSLGTEQGDLIAVSLTAGQTYTFSYRGTAEGGGPVAMNATNYNEPYSFHVGGCNFLYADGHVQFLRDSIDLPTFAALCTRSAGELATTAD